MQRSCHLDLHVDFGKDLDATIFSSLLLHVFFLVGPPQFRVCCRNQFVYKWFIDACGFIDQGYHLGLGQRMTGEEVPRER